MTESESQEWFPETLNNAFDTFDLAAYQQLAVRPLYKAKPRNFFMWASDPDLIFFYYEMDGAFVNCYSLSKKMVRVSAGADVTPLERKRTK